MRKAVKTFSREAEPISSVAIYHRNRPLKNPKQPVWQLWFSPPGLAAQAAGTGALLQHSIGLQVPGDQVEESVGRIMAGLTFLRQGCAHRKQELCRPKERHFRRSP